MTPVTLDDQCKFCGLPLREHTRGSDDHDSDRRPVYRHCAAALRHLDEANWIDDCGPADGQLCIRCGATVEDHYAWRELAFAVMGATVAGKGMPFRVELPTWRGCLE